MATGAAAVARTAPAAVSPTLVATVAAVLVVKAPRAAPVPVEMALRPALTSEVPVTARENLSALRPLAMIFSAFIVFLPFENKVVVSVKVKEAVAYQRISILSMMMVRARIRLFMK